jgi:hypothetical protein
LIENGFKINDHIFEDETIYLYRAELDYRWRRIPCEISIAETEDGKDLLIDSVQLRVLNIGLDEEEIDDIIWNRIIRPLEAKIHNHEK